MAKSPSTRYPPPSVSSFSALKVGAKLQEYEITSVLGEGGFGIVYLAHDKQLEREIAIKEYMPAALAARGLKDAVVVRSEQHRSTFEAGRQSFITEAKLLAKFKHPALVEIFRFWEQNGTAYMAMPFYRGQTLKQYVRENGAVVDERWLRAFLAPLLDALDQLHAINCYHRDISPDNILILEDGNPLLLDFGAARRIIGDLTQALTVILKPGYAPVEQYADDTSIKQGPWTDLYGMAAVCYFLITRSAPPAAVTRMMRDPMIPLARQSPAGYSLNTLSGIDAALRVKPDDRPRSVQEFQSLLGLNTYRANTRPLFSTPLPAVSIQGAEKTTPTDSSHLGEKQRDGPSSPNSQIEKSDDAPTQILPSRNRIDEKQERTKMAVTVPSASAVTARPILTPPPVMNPSAPVASKEVAPSKKESSIKRTIKLPIKVWAGIGALAALAAIAFFVSRDDNPPRRLKPPDDVVEDSRRRPETNYPPLEIAKTGADVPAQKPLVAPTPSPPSVLAPSSAAVVLQEPMAPSQKTETRTKDVATGSGEPGNGFIGPAPDKATLEKIAADKLAAEKLAATVGYVRLDIQPWGEVYVNGSRRALSPPAKQIPLPAGDYQISIRNPGFPSADLSISVVAKNMTVLAHQFR